MFRNLLAAISGGARATGAGVKRGVGAIGEQLEEAFDAGVSTSPDLMRTPPIMPDTERRRPSYLGVAQDRALGINPRVEKAITGADSAARPSVPIAPPPWKPAMDLPISRGDMVAPPAPDSVPITP